MEKLLVVADAEALPPQLSEELKSEYTLLQVVDHAQALTGFQRFAPKVVMLDLGQPSDPEGTSVGWCCLQRMLADQPDVKVVVLTGKDDRDTAYRALRCGAYDFHQKPVSKAELKTVIRRAFQLSGLEGEQRQLLEIMERRGRGLDGVVGQCAAMQRAFSAAKMVAASDVAVLITGESGTGKNLLARTIKSLGARAEGPFVAIKCDSLSKDPLDGELFGWEPAAGSGVPGPVPGKIELAQRGTLFLDEPAELSHPLQLRLLHLLRRRKLRRVGGTEDVDIDVRVICAASAKRVPAMRAGELPEDLYSRIAVVTLELPPLRARGEDIMLLAHLFRRKFARTCNCKARGFSPAAICALETHAWPGNVRELESRVQRGVIMSDGPFLEPGALGFAGTGRGVLHTLDSRLSLKEARVQVERKVISAALAASRGNLVKASELLDISRSTLYDLLKKHGLFHPEVRP
jgi:two-component system, NtrC family, response regulator